MKKLLLTILFTLVLGSNAHSSEFCDGFEDGYQKGYSYKFGFSGFTPFCPFQPFKTFGDPDDDYGHGFNIGLKEGCEGDSFCFKKYKK